MKRNIICWILVCLLAISMTAHDYSKDLPTLQEIKPGHFVYANNAEIEQYRKELKD